MPIYRLVVLTNAKPGQDAEFNRWYSAQHMPDTLKIAGFVSGQRFRLTELQRSAVPGPYRYLAIYEIETDHLGELIKELAARSRTPAMPWSEAIDDQAIACFFEPIGPQMTAT